MVPFIMLDIYGLLLKLSYLKKIFFLKLSSYSTFKVLLFFNFLKKVQYLARKPIATIVVFLDR